MNTRTPTFIKTKLNEFDGKNVEFTNFIRFFFGILTNISFRYVVNIIKLKCTVIIYHVNLEINKTNGR